MREFRLSNLDSEVEYPRNFLVFFGFLPANESILL
jgi:hypothetical protein